MLIKVLSAQLANMIAAGEVVERPSSAAKELCENSIDAGATSVTVEVSGGGIRRLSVRDNGCGIHPEDMETAFLRHATGKISSPDDLANILTLGFRGEALASIAAVSKVTMLSKTEGLEGKKVVMEGGKLLESEPCGCPVGTSVTVENLFYNTPARMKFLKKDYTESGYIEEAVRKLSLAHPEVSFRFISDGKEKIFTPGDGDLRSAAYSIYGKDVANALVPLDYSDEVLHVHGFVGNITLYRKNRALQNFYVNNRCVVNRTLTAAIEEGCKGMIPAGCFPVAILKIDINPSLVDVNVHPAKLEIKFFEENKVYSAVYWAVKNALSAKVSPKIDAPEEQTPVASVGFDIPKAKPAAVFSGFGTFREEGGKKGNEKYAYTPSAEEIKAFEQQKKEKPKETEQEEKAVSGQVTSACEEPHKEAESKEAEGSHKKIGGIEFVQSAEQITVTEKEENCKIIGQLFNTYILIEEGTNLVLIDQHAAHERLIYERLVREKAEKQILPQILLVPEVVKLTPVEMSVVTQYKAVLANLGWEIEEFGGDDVLVRGIPYVISKEQTADTLIEIIDNLSTGKQSLQTEKEDRILYTIACRSAVKGHDKLSLLEMQQLVKAVRESEKTVTCPHGRPVSTVVTKAFIEKLFKRL